MRSLVRVAICLLFVFTIGTVLASASTLNGIVYQNIVDPNNADDPANWNTLGPYATFQAPAINFDSRVTGYTPNLFLNLPQFVSFNSFDPNGDLNNTEIVITGLQYLSSGWNKFYITHDDGVSISMPGVSFTFDQPGPTSPVIDYFAINNPGAPGNYNFTLNYAECCGAPAVLVTNLGTATPEPGTLLMLGSGVLGLAGVVRRKLSL
jgi:hypothetical protein